MLLNLTPPPSPQGVDSKTIHEIKTVTAAIITRAAALAATSPSLAAALLPSVALLPSSPDDLPLLPYTALVDNLAPLPNFDHLFVFSLTSIPLRATLLAAHLMTPPPETVAIVQTFARAAVGVSQRLSTPPLDERAESLLVRLLASVASISRVPSVCDRAVAKSFATIAAAFVPSASQRLRGAALTVVSALTDFVAPEFISDYVEIRSLSHFPPSSTQPPPQSLLQFLLRDAGEAFVASAALNSSARYRLSIAPTPAAQEDRAVDLLLAELAKRALINPNPASLTRCAAAAKQDLKLGHPAVLGDLPGDICGAVAAVAAEGGLECALLPLPDLRVQPKAPLVVGPARIAAACAAVDFLHRSYQKQALKDEMLSLLRDAVEWVPALLADFAALHTTPNFALLAALVLSIRSPPPR
jgi:hypothetical protein